MTSRYSDQVTTTVAGVEVPVPGALVYVYRQTDGQLASIASDLGDTSNPQTADDNGNFAFNAADGFYDLAYAIGGKVVYREDGVEVGIADDIEALSVAASVAAVLALPFVVTGAAGQAVTTRGLLAGITTPANRQMAYLAEAGREGWFKFSTANLSASVTADTTAGGGTPLQGIYVAPAADTTGASGAWVRVLPGYIRPEWFGAIIGDPRSISVAIQAAADAAAALSVGVVQFNSVEYLIDHAPEGTGVTFQGTGATVLKRRNGIRTTIGGFTAGATPRTFTVADRTGFLVGQSVIFVKADGTDASPNDPFSHRNPVITAIVPGAGTTATVTVDPKSNLNARANGDYMQTASRLLILNAGSTASGIIFDGNVSNQQLGYSWLTHIECVMQGDDTRVLNCHFRETPADGILPASATAGVYIHRIRIVGCSFVNMGGNGVHLGLCKDVKADGCSFVNCNLLNTGYNLQHNDGGFIDSLFNFDVTVSNSYFENCWKAIGNVTTDSAPLPGAGDNSDFVAIGNTIKNCYHAFFMSEQARLVIFANNKIDMDPASRWGLLGAAASDGNGASRFTVVGTSPTSMGSKIVLTGNLMTNTYVDMAWAHDVIATGNQIDMLTQQGVDQSSCFRFAHCSNVVVEGNQLIGGQRGVNILNTVAASDSAALPILVNGNQMRDQKFAAVIGSITAPATSVRVQANNNAVTSSATLSDAGYAAFVLIAGMFATGNRIELGVGSAFAGTAPAGNHQNNVVAGAWV